VQISAWSKEDAVALLADAFGSDAFRAGSTTFPARRKHVPGGCLEKSGNCKGAVVPNVNSVGLSGSKSTRLAYVGLCATLEGEGGAAIGETMTLKLCAPATAARAQWSLCTYPPLQYNARFCPTEIHSDTGCRSMCSSF